MPETFTFLDGERLIRFGRGALGDAPVLLEGRGFQTFTLLTTERAAAGARALADGAAAVLHVPPGLVDEISAELLPRAGDRPLVALGGGRVIDTAKAIAGARGGQCAAIPTTLSGADLTPFHRTPRGVAGARLVRPALVVADPALTASQPAKELAASAMNAMAHAMEALYMPLSNPIAELAALRGAELLAAGLDAGDADRDDVALGALLAGWASAATGIGVHHATCQTIVRTAGTPHAETNAVMLPHFARLMAPRAPAAIEALAGAVGAPAPDRLAALSARCGHNSLSSLGVGEEQLAPVAQAVPTHPAYRNTPSPPTEDELLDLLRQAL